MSSTKRLQFFTIGNQIYVSKLSPITIDNWAERCVECGEKTCKHVADIIQYGLFVDKVTTIFECTDCGHTFHFDYEAMARASDTYILFMDGRDNLGEND